MYWSVNRLLPRTFSSATAAAPRSRGQRSLLSAEQSACSPSQWYTKQASDTRSKLAPPILEVLLTPIRNIRCSTNHEPLCTDISVDTIFQILGKIPTSVRPSGFFFHTDSPFGPSNRRSKGNMHLKPSCPCLRDSMTAGTAGVTANRSNCRSTAGSISRSAFGVEGIRVDVTAPARRRHTARLGHLPKRLREGHTCI